jgi:hypothetical protein
MRNILFIAILLLTTRLACTTTPLHRTVIRGSLSVAVNKRTCIAMALKWSRVGCRTVMLCIYVCVVMRH